MLEVSQPYIQVANGLLWIASHAMCFTFLVTAPVPLLSALVMLYSERNVSAQKTLDVINNGEIAHDFQLEENNSGINSACVNTIMDQSDTQYILQMTNNSVKSIIMSRYISTFIRAEDNNWMIKVA